MTGRPRIDGGRLWDTILRMAEVGATPGGGSRRLALSDEDRRARDLFVDWCRAAGCDLSVDSMGNIFARREGKDPGLPPVATGSHLDTQPHGGRFDGVYGVLAGLEVIRTFNQHGIETPTPLEVVVWTNEEGARFSPGMIGSGVFAGVYDLEFARSRFDAGGASLGEELGRIGYDGGGRRGSASFGAFLEAHIEQGPVLEREGKTVGVVTGAQGLRWYELIVGGRDAHAGSTPMPGRRDALSGASRMVTAMEDIALSHAPHGVATVGRLEVSPGSPNTIPGEARFTVDMRHPVAGTLDAMDRELRRRCGGIAERASLDLSIEECSYTPPVDFHPDCIAAVRAAAGALGISHMEITSGAGHDACHVSRVAPTGMIFVPCAGGLSHNEKESAESGDLAAGCDVLLHAMIELSESCRI